MADANFTATNEAGNYDRLFQASTLLYKALGITDLISTSCTHGDIRALLPETLTSSTHAIYGLIDDAKKIIDSIQIGTQNHVAEDNHE